MIDMKEKQEKVNAALWRIGMVKGARAVESFIRKGIDLTDEVKNLSYISQGAYIIQWRRAAEDSEILFPSFEKELEQMCEKVVDKCLPF